MVCLLLVPSNCVAPMSRADVRTMVTGPPSLGLDLTNAVMQGEVRNVKSLLAKGAPVNLSGYEKGGYTPLMAAANAGASLPVGQKPLRTRYEEIVRLLLSKGAQVNAIYEPYGATSLMIAANGQSPQIVRMLINRGAKVNAKDAFGSTALMQAARLDSLEIVKVLIAKGAQVDVANKKGYTALMVAASNSPRIIKYLLSKGANINAKSKSGATALIMAAGATRVQDVSGVTNQLIEADYKQKNDIVLLLLSNGANINARTKSGANALLRAVHTGSVNTVRLLLQKGSKSNVRDNVHGTPLALALRLNRQYRTFHRSQIVALLQKSGARA